MNKLCLIFNAAPHYRSLIYKMIDQTYDSDWYFGKLSQSSIKQMDVSIFHKVQFLDERRYLRGKIIFRKGLSSLISNQNYSTYILTGETHNISVWWFLIKAKLFYRYKHIYVWTHGWYGRESLIQRILKILFFSMVDGVFLYGNYAKQLMIKNHVKPSKLFVIHNSLQYDNHIEIRKNVCETDIYKKHFKNNDLNIIFIGRLTTEKRLDLLVDAVHQLSLKDNPVNLVLVGDGVAKDIITSKVNTYNLHDRVWLYGPCYNDFENAELLYNADLCVSPGNVGLTAIHSMTFGTPVITHNNFAYQGPEFEAIQPGKTGDFFHQGNVESMISVIETWFKTHKDREEVRQSCYNEIDAAWTPRFQLNVIKDHLEF